MTDSQADGRALAARYLKGLNDHDPDAVDGFVAVDYINHNAFVEDGREANRAWWSTFFTAFPDIKTTMDDLVVAGDRVVGRFTYRERRVRRTLGRAQLPRTLPADRRDSRVQPRRHREHDVTALGQVLIATSVLAAGSFTAQTYSRRSFCVLHWPSWTTGPLCPSWAEYTTSGTGGCAYQASPGSPPPYWERQWSLGPDTWPRLSLAPSRWSHWRAGSSFTLGSARRSTPALRPHLNETKLRLTPGYFNGDGTASSPHVPGCRCWPSCHCAQRS